MNKTNDAPKGTQLNDGMTNDIPKESLDIKDKLKELGFEVTGPFSMKEVTGFLTVINETGEVLFISDESKRIMRELKFDGFNITNIKHSQPWDVLELLINSARDEDEKKLFLEIAQKIHVLDKHRNIAS